MRSFKFIMKVFRDKNPVFNRIFISNKKHIKNIYLYMFKENQLSDIRYNAMETVLLTTLAILHLLKWIYKFKKIGYCFWMCKLFPFITRSTSNYAVKLTNTIFLVPPDSVWQNKKGKKIICQVVNWYKNYNLNCSLLKIVF